jgi:flavin-dependent dehydrogenase
MRRITIAGGGLAGLTLGIALRRMNVEVRIHEAGHYPRHRVCGEFISGHGLGVLRNLGLQERLLLAGAREGRTAKFYFHPTHACAHPLPSPALCISRHALDALLAEAFVEAGGELRASSRIPGEMSEPGLVWAVGRRRAEPGAGAWFGMKMHVRGLNLEADLEMHLVPDGYVGLCRLPGGKHNVCGLFRRGDPGARGQMPAFERLLGSKGSRLHAHLAGAEVEEESRCAVAGLDLRPPKTDPDRCRVGDAFGMIAPLTGNGMSMAFEAAAIAAASLERYAGGRLAWSEARVEIARGCDRAFRARLRWGAFLNQVVLSQPGSFVASLLLRFPPALSWVFGRTRGAVP